MVCGGIRSTAESASGPGIWSDSKDGGTQDALKRTCFKATQRGAQLRGYGRTSAWRGNAGVTRQSERRSGGNSKNDSGEDVSDPTRRDADGDAEGWIEVTYKRKGRVSPGEETAQKSTRSRSPMRRGGKIIVNKILQASKMPRLPAHDIKIIVRPRDGLSIRHTCRASFDEAIRQEAGVGCEEKRGRTPAGSRLTRPEQLEKQQHTTSPGTHIKVKIQTQVQAGSLGTTSLRVKVQKKTQDQERAEIHLEGKDARSDNEAARRTEDARQYVLEDMINKLSDKMEKMFEMLVVRLSDSEAECKALALKHDKRLEELEKKIS
ncbi:hypothetical protein HPB51_015172 [Rhipicephalus microplus]|uniref:Uncharacterized protein n=1 Tax=Rhipicephalus microplus TaxID=6941 RepID=A0A9J6DNP2_RHIMP|nr:hypothetical protein HPB51_015172 [Rhipicephalus microplus]